MARTDEAQVSVAESPRVRFGPELIDCEVDVPRALRYMGQRDGALGADLEERFGECARRCEHSASVRGIARCFPLELDAETGCIALEGATLQLPGDHIARHLDGCTHAVLMAVTLGMGNERLLAQAQATSPLDALLIDACSSSLAEEAAARLARIVDDQARASGFSPTRRFSPGYGDLALSIQPALLSTLQADRLLGMHANESFLMTPVKSVTAIIGLAPAHAAEREAPRVPERH